ncbi:MAG: hypothetical protein QOF27_2460, partial [Gaiellaceae bacterium]|nr:hypothetical protein [Gaiellaceae bacterium]
MSTWLEFGMTTHSRGRCQANAHAASDVLRRETNVRTLAPSGSPWC